MLVMTDASLATVEQLFEYKASRFELPPFPGYTSDQWGVKAHNRPWIEAIGDWKPGQQVIEVGGAYSRLAEYLAGKYGGDGWVGDDFGMHLGEQEMWTRWGDPRDLPNEHPETTYVFEPFGKFSPSYPDRHFDRVFSVSTLEHIPAPARLDVLKDMNRCTAVGGRQLHAIDVTVPTPAKTLVVAAAERVGLGGVLARRFQDSIRAWVDLFRASGVRIDAKPVSSFRLLDRQTLVESPDVCFRFMPPNEQPKPYRPTASLLVVVEDRPGG